jgi:hypothetical protein
MLLDVVAKGAVCPTQQEYVGGFQGVYLKIGFRVFLLSLWEIFNPRKSFPCNKNFVSWREK